MANPALLPTYVTPAELAGHLGIAERTLREIARATGAYRRIGKQMFFLEGDVQSILEAAKPCHMKSSSAAKSGTTGAAPPKGDSEALRERLTKPLPKGSRRKRKPESGNIILMERGRM